MGDIRFFVHLFDDSFINAKNKDIEDNLSDFIELVRELHGRKEISFSYDEEFYNVQTNENVSMADCIYSSGFDKQVCYNFEQVLSRLSSLKKKVVGIDSFKTLKPLGNDYSFWGLLFENKNEWCLSCSDKARKYLNDRFIDLLNPENFWDLKEIIFPKLKFISDIKKTIKSVTGGDFVAVKKDLIALNSYILANGVNDFTEKGFSDCSSVEISGESETVRKDSTLKRLRYFDIPGIGKVFCDKHMKTRNHRTYIYPDKENNIMWIAYIGVHLSTTKY